MINDSPDDAEQRGGLRAWCIWILAAICFGYAFFHRVSPSVMVSELMADFAIGGAVLGVLSALYFYPYVLLQVPIGALLPVMGTRRLLGYALILAALGSALFGLADNLYLAYLGRLLVGIGCSVGFLGSLALASAWFPADRYAFLAGLAMFFGMGSGMLAQRPLAFVVDQVGWRSSLLWLAGLGLLLACLVIVFIRNSPAEKRVNTQSPSGKSVDWAELGIALSQTLRRWHVWKIALIASALTGPMLTLGALWGTPYAMQAYNLSRPDAAFQMSFLLFGWAFGAPFCGWLSEKTGWRLGILRVCAGLLTALMGCLVIGSDVPLWLFSCLVFFIGVTGGGMTICFSLVRGVVPPALQGVATGVVNALTVASGALLQPLVGWGLDLLWSGKLDGGSRLYSAADYRLSFIVIMGSCLVGLALSLSLSSGADKTVFKTDSR